MKMTARPVGDARAVRNFPLKGGGRSPSEAKAIGWGSTSSINGAIDPHPALRADLPFQGEVSCCAAVPYAIAQLFQGEVPTLTRVPYESEQ